jgi:hypothetical protein
MIFFFHILDIESPYLGQIYKAATIAKFDSPTKTSKTEPSHPQKSTASSSEDEDDDATSKAIKDVNPRVFQLESILPKDVLLSRMRAVLYGNCIGDAIGLLTEFMTKHEALEVSN